MCERCKSFIGTSTKDVQVQALPREPAFRATDRGPYGLVIGQGGLCPGGRPPVSHLQACMRPPVWMLGAHELHKRLAQSHFDRPGDRGIGRDRKKLHGEAFG